MGIFEAHARTFRRGHVCRRLPARGATLEESRARRRASSASAEKGNFPVKKSEPPNPKWTIVDASFVLGAASADQLPPPALPAVAFPRRANVGKSSLLNALVARKGLVRAGR